MKKQMKKLMTFVMACTLLLSLASNSVTYGASDSDVFKDITGHWAKAQIEQAVAKGYVAGYPNGTFKPDAPVTRAQFITMLVRALGLEHGPEGSTWYTTYVKAAKEAAIYQGDADFAEWNMSKEISREHMAWLAVRAADGSLVTVESSGITKQATTNHWPMSATENVINRTEAEMLDYYHGFLTSEAFKKGILLGFGGNEIGLERTTTRAQSVTVIERILDIRAGKKLTTDKYAIAESELKWLKTNLFIVAPHIFDDQGEIASTENASYIYKNSMKLDWLKENLVLKNAYFHAEVNQIVLVNLGDPKDPNRKLLPPAANMGVKNNSGLGKVPKDAFIAIVNYEVIENKMPSKYTGLLHLGFSGYVSNDAVLVSSPKMFYTDTEKYDHLNNSLYDFNRKPTGKHTMTFIIPNSKFTLEKRLDRLGRPINDNLGRQINVSLEPLYSPGSSAGIRSTILSGKTTHYGK
ncbi:S-layer homology domain-containing protein [Paenibacillus sp. CAU 1782]